MRPLANITREVLEPIWCRRDIPTAKVAERLGVTRQALSLRAKTLGLPSRAGNQESHKRGDDDLFRRMWEAGVSTGDMARHFGYSYAACISTRRRNMGLPARPRGFRSIPISVFYEAEIGRHMRRIAKKRGALDDG